VGSGAGTALRTFSSSSPLKRGGGGRSRAREEDEEEVESVEESDDATSSDNHEQQAEAAAVLGRGLRQSKARNSVPLETDISKMFSDQEKKEAKKKKKKTKTTTTTKDKQKKGSQIRSESENSSDSHSRRSRTSEPRSSVHSDVSISELELFESPSELSKRPQGMHLPLPTFERSELVMGSLIAVTASGSVHSATWRGTPVAIKQLKMVELNRSRVMNDFRNEVELLGKLRHPTVVAMMAYCIDAPDLLLMMEYMEGGSLHDLLHAKKAKLSRLNKIGIALRIAQGMNFIHLSKIIHRDLKPQNILLDELNRPKICDFGLSKTREHTITHQGINGTAPYMAPELLDSDEAGQYGGKSDERVDVYSFAIVLWELFSRKKPWKARRCRSWSILSSLASGLDPSLRNVPTR